MLFFIKHFKKILLAIVTIGSFLYGRSSGKNKMEKEQLQDSLNDLRETQKRQSKRDSDSIADVRKRLLRDARPE